MGADTNNAAQPVKSEQSNTQNHECAMQPQVSQMNLSRRIAQKALRRRETVIIRVESDTNNVGTRSVRKQDAESRVRQQPEKVDTVIIGCLFRAISRSHECSEPRALEDSLSETVIIEWELTQTTAAQPSKVRKQDTESRVRAAATSSFTHGSFVTQSPRKL